MINPRLFDWYGIDANKNLGLKTFCPRPFDTILIDKNGSCFACECTAWLPQSIGNLNLQSLEDILKSPVRTHLQDSISNGSYRYCNNKQCSYLLDTRPVGWLNVPAVSKIKNIRLAIDDSCNLYCPSCRTHQIFEKNKDQLQRRYKLADKIIDYVLAQSYTINIHVGSDGDPFASLIYRYFIKKIKDLPNIKFTIQTNGLLIKKMYHRHIEFFKKLDVLNVSIDGATKITYESLRRGGNYEKIIENLEFIKKLKEKNNFKFIIHCIVQKENYHEMIQMVDIAKTYGADRIWLVKIENWNTYKNFKKVNVVDRENNHHEDFKKELEKLKKYKLNFDDKFIEIPTLNL